MEARIRRRHPEDLGRRFGQVRQDSSVQPAGHQRNNIGHTGRAIVLDTLIPKMAGQPEVQLRRNWDNLRVLDRRAAIQPPVKMIYQSNSSTDNALGLDAVGGFIMADVQIEGRRRAR